VFGGVGGDEIGREGEEIDQEKKVKQLEIGNNMVKQS